MIWKSLSKNTPGGSGNERDSPSKRLVRDIRRAPRKKYSAEEKIRIILDGLRGEVTIAGLCRREGIAERLYYTMKAEDVTDTLQLALTASGCDSARVMHKPRLLSDNGSSYISAELSEWLGDNGMGHVRGAPNHPQTQGRNERWHQTLKNRILLENYYLPGDLVAAVNRFVEHYNHSRYHESLKNLTPADVYFRQAKKILNMREKIKRKTIEQRRLTHFKTAA